MAKKQKDSKGEEIPNPSGVKDKDIMQRLNFLYQTSVYLAQASGSEPPIPDRKGKGHEKTKKKNGTLLDLSRQHTQTIKAIGRKAVLRM